MLFGEGKRIKIIGTTGIAATLLLEGRTDHKTFTLNVPLGSDSKSKIKKSSKEGDELAEIDVFFLDEGPMLPKYGIENIDEKLQELHENRLPFGGTVQPRANNSELMDLSIKNSRLWRLFNVHKLTKNIQVEEDKVEWAKENIDNFVFKARDLI
ncbi:unnamed protein product [Psylliodes chrysocephalus]|uniref:ATP-dependent DNA helicase n=1 Tax=Psylliodes chrysocephalus TaxID=3402493 RepID=A0A9P0CL53_9CUCU|nr:unnamed protein product [Psylliodes chrysocephala]